MADTSWNRTGAGPGEFGVGAVLNRASGILSRNWIALCGLFAVCLLPYLIILFDLQSIATSPGHMPSSA